jgi:anti-sigma-K factor RskA
MTDHDEIAELLGAYALDAVGMDERVVVEDHLRDCPRCRAEVEQHREAAAHLALTGADAPAGVWSRIAAELEPGDPGPTDPGPDLGRLYPLRRASPWPRRLVAVAAVILAAGFGALGWTLHRGSHAASLDKLMAAASLDPSSTNVRLISSDRRVVLTAVLDANGTGYLATNGTLPSLSAGRTYQLWGVEPGAKVSLGLLGSHPAITAFPAPAHGFVALAVTAEQSGGAAQPTSPPIAEGAVSG